jgi:UDP-N-acetylglucosamine transferase subunit ALG13
VSVEAIRNEDPFIFATVGTDHHRFDRMVEWVDRWLEVRAFRGATGLVQTGTSATPRCARSVEYLGYDQMEATIRQATAVVSHGGPGSIMLCASLGKRAIVVPRRESLGEHVDDHQLVFSRRLAAEGRIELAETADSLGELLDRALERGTSMVTDGGDGVGVAVERFRGLVDALLAGHAGPPPERPLRRRLTIRKLAPSSRRP